MAQKAQILVEAVDMTRTALESVERNLRGVNQAVASVTKSFGGLVGAVGAIEFGRQMVTNAMQAEQASNRLNAVLRATEHAAGLTKGQLDEMADALASSTQFDDESIRNAEAVLLKFGNVTGQVFQDGLRLATDYAAFIGTEVPDAAQTIGKALSSPTEGISALERQIGKLTPQQDAMIKRFMESGQIMEAQGVVLDALRNKIGGTAELMNTGLTKATTGARKSWDELLESIGRSDGVNAGARVGLAVIERTLRGIKDVVDTFNLDNLRKIVTLDFKAEKAGADPAVEAAARMKRLEQETASFDERMAKQTAEQQALLNKLRRESAEKAARQQEELIARGVKSDEAAAIARYDNAQELARMIGQIESAALRKRVDEEERLNREQDEGLNDSLGKYYDKLEQDNIEIGQAAAKERAKRLKGEKDLVDELSQVMAGWGRGFSRSMADMVINSTMSFDSIKTSFRGLLADIVAMQIDNQFTKPILKAGSNVLGGLLDKAVGGIFGGSSGASMGDMDTGAGAGLGGGGGGFFDGISNFFSGLKFANGGSFAVAGAGGTDSRFVNFMATQGERVTVETPAQQRAGGGPPVIHQTIQVGGNVTEADLPRIIEAARQGAMSGIVSMRDRGEF